MVGIEIVGLKALTNYMTKLDKEKISSFRKAGIVAVRDIQLHFRNSEGQNGKWKALTSRSGKPLLKTGALQQSISEHVSSKNEIEVGTNIVYAKMQNFGGIIKPKNGKYLSFKIGGQWVRTKQSKIPKREFVWLSASADEKIVDVLINSWEKL